MKNIKFCKMILSMFLVVGLNTAGLAADKVDFKKLIEQRAKSLVTVKFILNVSIGGMANMDQESENEMTCVMVSSDGLVICSNNKLSGFMRMINQISGGDRVKISATPKELKVIVGSDANTYEAEIFKKDSELDIVWIKIKNSNGVKFTFIDFASAKEAVVGDKIIILRRMGDYFDREIVVSSARVGGITSKPRKLYVADSTRNHGGGLPVFASNGDVIGFMVTQLPDADDKAQSLFRMISGNIQDGMSGLILPAAEVASATARAMQQ